MDMNTNNRGLSRTSTKQLKRMIDDAAWITYPLHVLVGILKMFVYVGLCILAVFISITVWLMNAHDNRAEWTKNFATEQSTYRVSFVNKTAYPTVVKRGTRFLDSDKAQLVACRVESVTAVAKQKASLSMACGCHLRSHTNAFIATGH
jgi:hypothetical protein